MRKISEKKMLIIRKNPIVALLACCWFAQLTETANNCTAIVCQNGGTCNNFTDSPPCICPLPYIAPYCAAAADYCETLQPDKSINSLPVCQNNGTCTRIFTDPYFNCTCPTGYTGIICNATVGNATVAPTSEKEQRGLSGGAIAGISIASIVFCSGSIGGIVFIVIFVHKRSKNGTGGQLGTRSNIIFCCCWKNGSGGQLGTRLNIIFCCCCCLNQKICPSSQPEQYSAASNQNLHKDGNQSEAVTTSDKKLDEPSTSGINKHQFTNHEAQRA